MALRDRSESLVKNLQLIVVELREPGHGLPDQAEAGKRTAGRSGHRTLPAVVRRRSFFGNPRAFIQKNRVSGYTG